MISEWMWLLSLRMLRFQEIIIFCQLSPGYHFSEARLCFLKNQALGFFLPVSLYVLRAGCSQGWVWEQPGAKLRVWQESPPEPLLLTCVLASLISLSLGTKKEVIRPVDVTASPSFRASLGLVSSLGCGPVGPVELGTVCKLILSTKPVPKTWRATSLTPTPDLESVREVTLWRWLTHSCTLSELREAFGLHSMLFTPGFQSQSACTWAEAWPSHMASWAHTAAMLTGCPEFPGLEQNRLEHPLLEIFRVCYNNSIQH